MVAQEQKEELVRLGEERERLGRQLGEASARLREVEEQGAREHREDTTSLSMLHSQLTSLAAEKYVWVCIYTPVHVHVHV